MTTSRIISSSWRTIISIQLIMICLIAKKNIAFCPSKCRCEEDNNLRIDCPNAALAVVPIQLNPDVKFINLTFNQIQNVHFTLQFYYNLEVLDLSYNHINSLGSKNFESQEHLRTFDLSYNFIAHLKKDAFRGLRRLHTLILRGNRIADIHATAMLDLVSMQHLVLANNSMVSLENGTLHTCARLQSLDLKQNELLDVPIENLHYASQTLRTLDLSQNFIQRLSNRSFESLGNLQQLYVSGNVLNDIEAQAFEPLKRLTHLSLADNNITDMPSMQLSYLSNLSYLSISGNNIVSLPALAFVNLFQLKDLHINRMDRLIHVDERAFVDNTLLQTLSLDNNLGITRIPSNLFRNNPKLIEIQMRGNSLTSVEASHFPTSQYYRLYLADNPLVCNCSILWLWHLTQAEIGRDATYTTDSSTHKNSAALRKNVVLADKANVTCEIGPDPSQTRHVKLAELTYSEIKCPAYVSYMVAVAIVGLLVVILVAASVIRLRLKGRGRNRERKHMEQMVPQHNEAKCRFEEYRQQTAITGQPVVGDDDDDDDDDELDHYEQFDDYRYDFQGQAKQPSLFQLGLQPPSIVYV